MTINIEKKVTANVPEDEMTAAERALLDAVTEVSNTISESLVELLSASDEIVQALSGGQLRIVSMRADLVRQEVEVKIVPVGHAEAKLTH